MAQRQLTSQLPQVEQNPIKKLFQDITTAHPGEYSVPGTDIKIPDLGASEFIKKMITGQSTGSLHNPLSQAEVNIPKVGTKDALTTSKVTDKGLERTTMPTDTLATQGNLSGSIASEQHPQVIQLYIMGKVGKDEAAAAIASPEAKVNITKAINQAMKTNDMDTVHKLAELNVSVDRQLQFIDMIGRAILAQAQGFGTQNAPGVTEARMPLVQQGVGQALTSTPTAVMPQGQGVDAAQYLRPRFQDVAPAQNKPVRFPYAA